MSPVTARRSPKGTPRRPVRGPLPRQVRRDVLLDAAVTLLERSGGHAVSMDAVAEQAGVSRPLVYKHFANIGELMAAVYGREAEALHEELAEEVAAAGTLEEMYRVLIRGLLRAAGERGPVFTALRAAVGRSRELREEQHGRNRETIRAFSARAGRELGIGRDQAMPTAAVLLGAADVVIARWLRNPTEEQAQFLEDLFMRMVAAAYEVAKS
jgi:AcrR family transcriptional regulator